MKKTFYDILRDAPTGTWVGYRLFLVPKETMTVKDWLNEERIEHHDRNKYPNAYKANEIKKSPLYKALS